jgi:predicted Zn-dependent protease
MQFDMDFQQSNGYGTGAAYRVKDGKVVSRVANSALLFRATDLWKSLRALGGKESARRYPQGTRKGQPQQDGAHSVTAVPALLKEVTIIDAMRKA